MRNAGNLSALKAVLASLAVLVCVAPSASANAGVPMLFVVWPASWLLLVPVILIEAWVAVRMLGIGFVMGLKLSARVNLITTLIGIPATWAILVGVQIGSGWIDGKWLPETLAGKIAIVTLQSPWLMSFEEHLDWMVPAAAAFLCIPFFLMSVAIEAEAACRFLRDRDAKAIRRWAWLANGLTYGLIWIGLGITVARAL